MAESFPADILRELVARGRLAPAPAPQPLPGGNTDRRQAGQRAWRAVAANGRELKLVLGRELGPRARRQEEFAAAAPDLVARPLFLETVGTGDVLAEPYYGGGTLENRLSQQPATAARAAEAFGRALRALRETEKPSIERARRAEWDGFISAVLADLVWTDAEREHLRRDLLPALYPTLGSAPPVTRWSNGDLTADNLVFDAGGQLRLVDLEFAQRTHFFTEDAVRFLVFSASARARPELFLAQLAPFNPAWHLFFWLRQFHLECRQNSADYLARVRPGRLGLIRRQAETLLGVSLSNWSVPALPLEHHLEDARWVHDGNAGIRIAGWCHVPGIASRRVVVTQGAAMLAESPALQRPDVAGVLGAAARDSGYELRFALPDAGADLVVAAVADDGRYLPFARITPDTLPGRGPATVNYAAWAARHDPDPAPPATPPEPGPRCSILVPVYNPPVAFLRACLDSVLGQHYTHWELRIVDDASTDPAIRACLEEYAQRDSRIHLQFRSANGGISRATNDALGAAQGEYLVLLDHDDELRPHALLEIARKLQSDPEIDVLYSDEEKITAEGQTLLPFLKPAFSPEFLLGVMYPGHALCVRAATARAAGGFDSAFDGVQDYEFFLRLTERTRRIAHLPRVLYRWRQSPGSSALHANVKGDMDSRQSAAVRAHLRRRGDMRDVRPLGGHRALTCATTGYSTESVAFEPATGPLTPLRRISASAEIILISAVGVDAPFAEVTRELAALAALSDSGFVAPVLLDSAGRVFESGWTYGGGTAGPLMRGFDPAGDGYNGSLRCHREVAAVSPICAAVRVSVLQEALAALPPEADWFALLEAMRARGLFHRICASAAARVPEDWQDVLPTGAIPAEPDPFFNPHFDASRGDYSLAGRPGHFSNRPEWLWHLDVVPDSISPDGGIEVRGWCFRPDRQPVTVRLRAGAVEWAALCQLARPDVATAHEGLTDGACGFSLRVRLPAGTHQLSIAASSPGGGSTPLLSKLVRVPALAALRRWLRPDPARLLVYQLLAGPTRPPSPLRGESFPSTPARTSPRFSIVTPSFNQARFLEEAMRSVLSQEVALDYVVQDGGSTDGSASLLARVAAEHAGRDATRPRLLGWVSEPDHGQADALVRGFTKTGGAPDDVMAWINSDDFYLPGALRYVADYFARHPDVDAVYGHRVLVDSASREIGRWYLPPHSDEILRLNDFVPQETLFWRRRLWEKAGGIDPSFRFAMDWDLLLRFVATGARLVRVPYALACFRLHPAQKTSAAMQQVGQVEIDHLRARAQGRELSPAELEADPRILGYLRHSARLEWLASLGIRGA